MLPPAIVVLVRSGDFQTFPLQNLVSGSENLALCKRGLSQKSAMICQKQTNKNQGDLQLEATTGLINTCVTLLTLHVESIVLPENSSQYIKFRLDFKKPYRFSGAENSGPSNTPLEHEREMCQFTKSVSLSVEQLQCLQRNSASAQWLKNKLYELNGHSIIWMRMRFPADLVNADWCVRRLCADEHQGDPSMHLKWIQFKWKGIQMVETMQVMLFL